jgi:hypothetical protein
MVKSISAYLKELRRGGLREAAEESEARYACRMCEPSEFRVTFARIGREGDGLLPWAPCCSPAFGMPGPHLRASAVRIELSARLAIDRSATRLYNAIRRRSRGPSLP